MTLAPVQPRIHVVTLAVDDLERALAFYRGLGWHSPGIVGTEFKGDATNAAGDVAMFRLHSGLILSLYPRSELAKDANLPVQPAVSGGFSLGHAVASGAEVDTVLAKAEAVGATITEPPRERPWGIYGGYFRDPDGHLWEILWNPTMEDLLPNASAEE
jgi:catechol 2,3-dioxygenase-like lactoylglutathione lyase family enzyme